MRLPFISDAGGATVQVYREVLRSLVEIQVDHLGAGEHQRKYFVIAMEARTDSAFRNEFERKYSQRSRSGRITISGTIILK